MATTAQHMTWGEARLHPAYQSYQLLHMGFTVLPILAGLDKFFHLLTNWDMYLSPIARHVLGNLSHPFMLLVGVIEMIVGLMVITRWTRIGAYIASIWLLLIAINLVTTGQYFDIALRDIGLALSAFGLAKLSEGLALRGIRGRTEKIAA